MPESKKTNDMFLNLIYNPTYNVLDFMDMGLDAENTQILPFDEYRNNEQVKARFTDKDGLLHENAMRQAYDISVKMYNDMANTDYNRAVLDELKLQPGSTLAMQVENPKFDTPEDNIRVVEFGKDTALMNPDRRQFGTIHLTNIEDPKYTPKELAEMHQAFNRKTGEWEKGPEDWSLKSLPERLFGGAYVMATYDEDDPEVKRGERKVGEYKLNEQGTYYSEKLDGEPVHNKDIISFWDTLTKEKSWAQRYDFFDADGFDKNIAGSAFRTIATIAPVFIKPISPYYVGLSLAFQVGKLMDTVGKMALGSNVPFLNNAESWLGQFDYGTSEYGKQHAFSSENVMRMMGDIFMQFKQQRWIFEKAPKLLGMKDANKEEIAKALKEDFKNTHLSEMRKKYGTQVIADPVKAYDIAYAAENKAVSDLMKYTDKANQFGKTLSQLYMTGITGMSAFNDAKQQGATDGQAAALALGYMFGEYKLLNTAIGEMVFPELRLDRKMTRRALDILMGAEKQAAVQSGKGAVDKAVKDNLFKRAVGFGKGIFDGTYHGGDTAKAIFANALGEGIEETSEELLYDVTKGIFNAYYDLTGENLRYKTFDDMGERYGMSFFGGMLGGGLFSATNNFKAFGKNGPIANMDYKSANEHIMFLIRNKQKDLILKELNKGTYGNKNLSTQVLNDGQMDSGYAQGTITDNQDLAVKKLFKDVLDFYEDMMDASGVNYSDSEIIDKNLIQDIRFNALKESTASALYLNDFNDALNNLLEAKRNVVSATNFIQTGDPSQPKLSDSAKPVNDTPEAQQALANAQKAFEDAQQEVQDYVNGNKRGELILKGVFETNPYLHETFKDMDFNSWLQSKYSTEDIRRMSAEDLNREMTDYKNNYQANGKDDLRRNFAIFSSVMDKINPVLVKEMQEWLAVSKNKGAADVLAHHNEADMDAAVQAGMSGQNNIMDMYIKSAADPVALKILKNDKGLITDVMLDGRSMGKELLDPALPENDRHLQLESIVAKSLQEMYSSLTDMNKLSYVSPEMKRIASNIYKTYKSVIENPEFNEADATVKKLAGNVDAFILGAEDSNGEYDNTDAASNYHTAGNRLEKAIKERDLALFDEVVKELKYINGDDIDAPDFNGKGYKLDDNGKAITGEDFAAIQAEDMETLQDLRNAMSVGEFTRFYDKATWNNIQKIFDDFEKKPLAPIYEALDAMYAGSPKKASQIVKEMDDRFSSAATSPEGFNLSSSQSAELASLQNAISLTRSALFASQDGNLSVGNPEGYASLSNRLMQGKEGYTPYNIIDKGFANAMQDELDRLDARITAIRKLSDINSSRKLEQDKKMFVNRAVVSYNGFKRLLADMDKPNSKAGIDFTKIRSMLDGTNPDMEIVRKYADNPDMPIENIIEGDYNRIMLSMENLEAAVRDAFKDKAIKETFKEALRGKSLNMSSIETFNIGTRTLPDASFVWYLGSVIAADQRSVGRLMEQVYKNKDIAPTPGQELSVRMLLGYISNKDVFNNLVDAYRETVFEKIDGLLGTSIDDTGKADTSKQKALIDELKPLNVDIEQFVDEYNKAKSPKERESVLNGLKIALANGESFPIFDNIFAISGIPGAGKTAGTIRPFIRALLAEDEAGNRIMKGSENLLKNIMFVTTENMIDDVTGKIEADLGDKGKIKGYTHEEALKFLFGKDYEQLLKNVTIDINGDRIMHTHVGGISLDNMPSMIILDEFSKLTQLQIDAINQISKRANIPVVFLGDGEQSIPPTSVSIDNISLKGTNLPAVQYFGNAFTELLKASRFTANEGQFIYAPKLGMSMRSNNSQKVANETVIRQTVKLIDEGKPANIDMHYHDNGTELYGDAYFPELNDESRKIIDNMLDNSTENIGYIYNSNSQTFKYLMSRGLIKKDNAGNYTSERLNLYEKASDALGLETKYYIYDIPSVGSMTPQQLIRELHVAMSRSEQGSLITGTFKDKIQIQAVKDDSTSVSTYNKAAIDSYTEKYLGMMAYARENVGDTDPLEINYKQPENANDVPLPAGKPSSKKNVEPVIGKDEELPDDSADDGVNPDNGPKTEDKDEVGKGKGEANTEPEKATDKEDDVDTEGDGKGLPVVPQDAADKTKGKPLPAVKTEQMGPFWTDKVLADTKGEPARTVNVVVKAGDEKGSRPVTDKMLLAPLTDIEKNVVKNNGSDDGNNKKAIIREEDSFLPSYAYPALEYGDGIRFNETDNKLEITFYDDNNSLNGIFRIFRMLGDKRFEADGKKTISVNKEIRGIKAKDIIDKALASMHDIVMYAKSDMDHDFPDGYGGSVYDYINGKLAKVISELYHNVFNPNGGRSSISSDNIRRLLSNAGEFIMVKKMSPDNGYASEGYALDPNDSLFANEINDIPQQLTVRYRLSMLGTDDMPHSILEFPVLVPLNPLTLFNNSTTIDLFMTRGSLLPVEVPYSFVANGKVISFTAKMDLGIINREIRNITNNGKRTFVVYDTKGGSHDMTFQGFMRLTGNAMIKMAESLKKSSTNAEDYDSSLADSYASEFVAYGNMFKIYSVNISNAAVISTKAFYDSMSTDGPEFYSITLGDDYENNDYMFIPELRDLESAFGMAGKKLNHTNVLYSNISQDKYGIQAKMPFIIIGTNDIPSNMLFETYKAENGDNPPEMKKTRLVYVTPPVVSLERYIQKLENIYTKNISAADNNIGNMYTSYRILKRLFRDPDDKDFKNGLSKDMIVSRINGIRGGSSNPDYLVGNGARLSDMIYDVLSPIVEAEMSGDMRKFSKILNRNEARNMNTMLFALLAKDAADMPNIINERPSVLNKLNSDYISRLDETLKEEGFKGVFIFPKLKFKDGENVVDTGSISIRNTGMDVDMDYSLLGRMEMPEFVINYSNLFNESMFNDINGTGINDYNAQRVFYDFAEDMAANNAAASSGASRLPAGGVPVKTPPAKPETDTAKEKAAKDRAAKVKRISDILGVNEDIASYMLDNPTDFVGINRRILNNGGNKLIYKRGDMFEKIELGEDEMNAINSLNASSVLNSINSLLTNPDDVRIVNLTREDEDNIYKFTFTREGDRLVKSYEVQPKQKEGMKGEEKNGMEEATDTELDNVIAAMNSVRNNDFGQFVEDLVSDTEGDRFEQLLSEDDFVAMYPKELDRNKANYFNYQMNKLKDALSSYSDNLARGNSTDDNIKAINDILDKHVPYFIDEESGISYTNLREFIDCLANAEIDDMLMDINNLITTNEKFCKL